MFNASKGYGAAFDNDIWQPEGMSDAITSDQGLGGFVEDQYKAHKEEMRFAGDALNAYTDTVNVKENTEAQVDAAKTRYELMKKNQQGSGGGGFGQIAGVAAKAIPMVAGLFCDMRLKEDVSLMSTTGDVKDKLAAMALAVKHLKDVHA